MRAWMVLAALPIACTEVDGKLTSAGQPLGDFEFVADDCQAGSALEFNGVSLKSSTNSTVTVRLVDDVLQGKVVVVETLEFDDPGLQIRAAQCRRFRVDFDYDSCNGYEGALELDCDVAPPGVGVGQATTPGTLRGKITFSRCN
jgi:hypothetical protein